MKAFSRKSKVKSRKSKVESRKSKVKSRKPQRTQQPQAGCLRTRIRTPGAVTVKRLSFDVFCILSCCYRGKRIFCREEEEKVSHLCKISKSEGVKEKDKVHKSMGVKFMLLYTESDAENITRMKQCRKSRQRGEKLKKSE